MDEKKFHTSAIPDEHNQRLLEWRQRLADARGVKVTTITKTGDALGYVLDLAEVAAAMGIVPAIQTESQP